MSRFIDGPAKGVFLSIQRAPFFLRVVNSGGDWDALDQLDDQPKPDEEITVYMRVSVPALIHVHLANPRRGYWMQSADYRVLPEQPLRDAVDQTDRWRQWCIREAPAIARKLLDTEAETEGQRMDALSRAAFPGDPA